MHKLTNKQYEEYMKMIRDKEEGRLLTPDGLRMICSANKYDPEKIGPVAYTHLALNIATSLKKLKRLAVLIAKC